MHVAFGIGVLLAGGWILPGQVPDGNEAIGTSSVPQMPAVQSATVRQNQGGYPNYPGGLSPSPYGEQQPRSYTGYPGSYTGYPGGMAGGTVGRTAQSPMMPVAPTDPAAALLTQVPPTGTNVSPYHAQTPFSTPRPGLPQAGWGNAPRPFSPRSYDPIREQAVGTGTIWQTARAAQPGVPSKPFAGYRPSPPVSPYLTLGARDAGQAYYNFVRPFTEQRYVNQQVGDDIHGLESLNRSESAALQQIHQQQQIMQGTAGPQYYMNTQQYYPGFGQ